MDAQPQTGYTLPDLPYAYDALEPYIDARTMEIHHSKHHAGYVKKVNAALEGNSQFAGMSIFDLLKKENLDKMDTKLQQAVVNNGGGHANHSMFWPLMGKSGGGEPGGDLLKEINAVWNSFGAFKEAFTNAALTQFGSGWAWLAVGTDGKLAVASTPNQNNPVSAGMHPILGIDVWEHAYYLKYQNKRPDYVEAWWNTINWGQVEDNWKSAK